MMWSNYANVALSAMLGAVITYQLLCSSERMNFGQRLGLALWGAAVVLSIAPQLDVQHKITPFSNWYQCLWRIGGLLFVGCSLIRDRRHDRANREAKRIAWERMSPDRRAEYQRRRGS